MIVGFISIFYFIIIIAIVPGIYMMIIIIGSYLKWRNYSYSQLNDIEESYTHILQGAIK